MGTSDNRTACHRAARHSTLQSRARCLNGTSTLWVGNSETIELLEWLMSALACCHKGLRLVSRFKFCTRKTAHFRKTALCKEDLYAEAPYSAECTGFGPPNSTTLDFRWKSDMRSRHDEGTRQLVLQRATSRPMLVLLGGGVSHFTRFADYTRGLNSVEPEGWTPPQHWLDDFANETDKLFHLFSPASMPPNVCVVWKPMQIAPRHNGSGGHHPSTVGGFHDRINGIARRIAWQHGIPALETTRMLSAMRPKGFKQADARGRGGSEGDPYHGYPAGAFLPQMLEQACAVCPQLNVNSARGRLVT